MKKPSSQILIWVISWLMIAGGSIYLLPFYGADQLNKFYVTTFYFLSFAYVGGFFYEIHIKLPNSKTFIQQMPGILSLSVFVATASILIDKYFPLEVTTVTEIMNSKFYFPLFRAETLLTKFSDILFQQIFILGILRTLLQMELRRSKIQILFTAVFFLIHLPLVFSFGHFSIYFVVSSLLAGFIFSYLILNFSWGFVMSFGTHWLFYFGLGIWLRYF